MLTIVFVVSLIVSLGANVAFGERIRKLNKVLKGFSGKSDDEVLSYLEISSQDSFIAQKLLAAASTIDVQTPAQNESYDNMVIDIKKRDTDANSLETLKVWLDRRPVKLTEQRVLELEDLFSDYGYRKLVRDIAFKYMERNP